MTASKAFFALIDNGGRRSGIDPRHFSYDVHVPERRSIQDRRSGNDRRSGVERRNVIETIVTVDRRKTMERRAAYKALRE
jgi:hypothetical protein